MKLYFAPGACSMAPHIVLREAGYTFDLEKVDLAKKQTASGEDYTQINPKGYVPALRLGNGEVLTEAAVTLQYLADQKPESGLAPKTGTMERYRAALVLGAPIASADRALEGSIWQRSKTLATDPASWLGTLWSMLLLPIGIAGFTVAVTVWSTVLGLVTSPAWTWSIDNGDAPDSLEFFNSTGAGYSVLRVVLGLALVPLALCVGVRWRGRSAAIPLCACIADLRLVGLLPAPERALLVRLEALEARGDLRRLRTVDESRQSEPVA